MQDYTDFEVSWRNLSYRAPRNKTIVGSRVLSSSSAIISNWFGSIVPCGGSRKSYSVNKSTEFIVPQQSSSFGTTDTRQILNKLDGSFKSSELTAIMGPSGAGKTSLMNFLSRRLERGFTGTLSVHQATGAKKRRLQIAAFPQHDHLVERLTVRENLIFASRIKSLSATTGRCHEHAEEVYKVSSLLNIAECLDTLTGDLSGGQQRRLSIAQELLSRPDILILDEPTSGLDSFACLKTLTVLKDLIRASKERMIAPVAIVLTIHQPEEAAFDLFDKLYLIAKGGVAIYHGPPVGCAPFLATHAGLDSSKRLPTKMTTADSEAVAALDHNEDCTSFAIAIASGEFGQQAIDALAARLKHDSSRGTNRSPQAAASFDGSISLQNLNESHPKTDNSHQLYCDPCLTKSAKSSRTMGEGARCFIGETRLLAARCWTIQIRQTLLLAARIGFHLLLPLGFALIVGTEPGKANVCPNIRKNYSLRELLTSDQLISEQFIEERQLSVENMIQLFVTLYMCVAVNVAASTLLFVLDMRSSLKEFNNGWYSPAAYLIGRLLSNGPMDILLPMLAMVIFFPITGQVASINYGDDGSLMMMTVWRIALAVSALTLASLSAQLLGMMCGAFCIDQLTTALFSTQAILFPLIFLAGFTPRGKVLCENNYLIWRLSTISPLRHSYDLLTIARWGYNVCPCNEAALPPNGQVEMVGVSEKLRAFTGEWFQSESDLIRPLDDQDDSNNATAGKKQEDFFQQVAKQIMLYNTNGIEIKSCNDVMPYQLGELVSRERDVGDLFRSLMIIYLTSVIMLFITLKLVIRYKASL